MDKPMMVKKSGGVLYLPEIDLTVTGDGGGEYTMPDYFPEIRRVVSVSATALPDSKFLSGNLLEYGGTLSFSLLYIGDDGALVCLPYSCEYQGSAQLPGEAGGGISVDTAAENPQCRVLAPRSVSLKARLRSRICEDGDLSYSCRSSDTEGAVLEPLEERTIEKLTQKIQTLRRGRVSTTGSVTGELRDGRGARPVSCEGWVSVSDVSVRRDIITVRGEIALQCIVFGANGLYSGARGKIPFEESIPADGVSEGDTASAWGRVASVTVNADGDGGAIHAEVEYDLDAMWFCRGEAETVCDAYSTEFDTEIKRRDITAIAPVCCMDASLSVSATGNASPSPDAYLIDASASPVFDKAECRDEKIIFSGSCGFRAYVASSGDVTLSEISVPLKYETKAENEAAPQELQWQAQAAVSDLTARLDGGKISVNAEISVSAQAVKKQQLHPVWETVIDRRSRRALSGTVMKICYPSSGEPVWETAKKCRAKGAELEKINKVRRTDISDGTPLIITIK